MALFEGGAPAKKWAQLGYIRERQPGTTSIDLGRYTEVRAGPNPQDYDFHFESGVPAGTHKYKCYLISSLFGTWRFEIDDVFFNQYTHNGWEGVTGDTYHWAGEIFNSTDQMVGTETAKCQFAQLQVALNWGSFQDQSISQGDLHTDDPDEWGIELCVCSYSFFIWDKIP